MFSLNLADLGVMTSVATLLALCVKSLKKDKKNGICSCGRSSCSGCTLCKAAQRRKH